MAVTLNNNTRAFPGHSLGEWQNTSAFAFIKTDGSVVTWGSSVYGGDSSAVAAQLDGNMAVTQIFATGRAFAALRADGSVVTWGDSGYGGDSHLVAPQLDGSLPVTQIFATGAAFAALRADGSVVTWGIATAVVTAAQSQHNSMARWTWFKSFPLSMPSPRCARTAQW